MNSWIKKNENLKLCLPGLVADFGLEICTARCERKRKLIPMLMASYFILLPAVENIGDLLSSEFSIESIALRR